MHVQTIQKMDAHVVFFVDYPGQGGCTMEQ